MLLKIVCAWCDRPIATKATGQAGKPPSPASHGICQDCAKKETKRHIEARTGHKIILLKIPPPIFSCGIKISRFVKAH